MIDNPTIYRVIGALPWDYPVYVIDEDFPCEPIPCGTCGTILRRMKERFRPESGREFHVLLHDETRDPVIEVRVDDTGVYLIADAMFGTGDIDDE